MKQNKFALISEYTDARFKVDLDSWLLSHQGINIQHMKYDVTLNEHGDLYHSVLIIYEKD